MTDTEVVAEGELREWATARNITATTVDLLVKDGFSSMDAIELLDKEDLAQSKIPRGQQKLLLKALQPRQATAEQTTEQTAEVTEATAAATAAAAATGEDGATAPARDQAAGAGQNQLAGETERELYTQLMREHLRTMQGTTATTPVTTDNVIIAR